MKSNGVPSANASGAMTENEWNRRKASWSNYGQANQNWGQGGTEVNNYSSYTDYLNDYVEYQIHG